MNQFSFSPVGQAAPLGSADTSIVSAAGDCPIDSVEPSRSTPEESFQQFSENVPAANNRRAEASVLSMTTERRSRSRSGPSSSALGPRIRAERQKLGLSQQGFAVAVQAAGQLIGTPNGCTKRLVQKWERGEHKRLTPAYQHALAHLTGIEYSALHAPASSPDTAKVGYALEGCIAWLATFGRDLVELHRQLMQLQACLSAGELVTPPSHASAMGMPTSIATEDNPAHRRLSSRVTERAIPGRSAYPEW